jgi:tellurite resistance protein TerC
MNIEAFLFFSLFIVFILLMLFLDLKVIGRKSHEVSFKEAIFWSVFWISLALLFYLLIRYKGDWVHGIKNWGDIQDRIIKYHHPINIIGKDYPGALDIYRRNLGLEYITGWLIEKSLSVDNLFVMVMIFFAFGVRKIYYKHVLFWGILGAIVLRFIFIFGSAAIIQQFSWFLYFFGALLIFTGIKMFIERNKRDKKINIAKHPVVKFTSKHFRVYPKYVNKHFFIRKNDHKLYITPLFLVLLVIEFSDVIFAADSIPAIFSVTEDPYIIFFSNIFAILGLRSLFFLVLKIINMFRYLKHGLSILLTFIGVKLIFNHWLKEAGFTTAHSLYIVLGILVISILFSIILPDKEKKNLSE